MKTLFYASTLLLLLTATKCHKPAIAKPYYSMDPVFKKNFIQGWQGSTWIYSDSLGTYYDTVILLSASKETGTAGKNYEGEGYSTHYDASNCDDYFIRMSTQPAYNGTDTMYNFDLDDNLGNNFQFFMVKGQYTQTNGRIQFIDSITVLGKKYYNVLKLYGGSAIGTAIIDPNIGIIYKEAWSKRPSMGIKKFYLKEYHLK